MTSFSSGGMGDAVVFPLGNSISIPDRLFQRYSFTLDCGTTNGSQED